MYRYNRKSKCIIILLILIISINSLTAAGAPVFDVENWLYSILSYTQMGTDTANFLKNMQREIELAQKLYQSISDGDIQSAFSTFNAYTNRLEKKLDAYNVQSEIFSQINDLQQASLDWSNHIDDPAYFTTVLEEIDLLEKRLSTATLENTETIKEDARAYVEESSQTSQSIGIKEESTTALQQKTLNATEKQAAQAPITQMDQNTSNLAGLNKEDIEALKLLVELYQLKSTNKAKFQEAMKNIEANTPVVDVNLSDPFAI